MGVLFYFILMHMWEWPKMSNKAISVLRNKSNTASLVVSLLHSICN